MIHADMGAQPCWLDTLRDEMEKYGADVISTIVPIKDDRGLTSTAIDNPDDPWIVRRITMKEALNLPTTFGDKEAGGPLLLNTGLWLVKLGPWCLEENEDGTIKHRFHIRDTIRREKNAGRRVARVQPEDWDFSRQMRRAGLKLAATRAVRVEHHGDTFYPNDIAWGWDTDRQNAPKISATGCWLDANNPDGFLHDAPLADALGEMFAGKSVYDLGCGRGAYVSRFRELGIECQGVDGNPETSKINPDCEVTDLTHDFSIWNSRDWVLSLEVGEHIPAEFQDAFIRNLDHANSEGVVISWAIPGQEGRGHVNCKSNADIKGIFAAMGYANDIEAEEMLRGKATLPYLKNTLMVFRKAKTEARRCQSDGILTPEHSASVS